MRSKTAQRILNETPEEVRIFVKLYSDIVVRISELLKQEGITQKELAEKMNKMPSEISKWLNGDHNFTLKSLAKLEAELGAPLLEVPKTENKATAIYKVLHKVTPTRKHRLKPQSFKNKLKYINQPSELANAG